MIELGSLDAKYAFKLQEIKEKYQDNPEEAGFYTDSILDEFLKEIGCENILRALHGMPRYYA